MLPISEYVFTQLIDMAQFAQNLQELIQSSEVRPESKLRLAMLYALRYQKFSGNQINQIVKLLPDHGVSESDAGVSTASLALSPRSSLK
jgi:hypothetical protein